METPRPGWPVSPGFIGQAGFIVMALVFIFIEQCKSLGFTLQEIGNALKERDSGALTALRQQELLEEKLRSIEERIATLREAERKLRAKVKRPRD